MWNYLGTRYDKVALECDVCKKTITIPEMNFPSFEEPLIDPIQCPYCNKSSKKINWNYVESEVNKLQAKSNSHSIFGATKLTQEKVDALLDKHIDIIEETLEKELAEVRKNCNIPDKSIKVSLQSPVTSIGYMWLTPEDLKVAHSFDLNSRLDKNNKYSKIINIDINSIHYFTVENLGSKLTEKTVLYYDTPLKIVEFSGEDFEKLDNLIPNKNFNTLSLKGDKPSAKLKKFTTKEIDNAVQLSKIYEELDDSITVCGLTQLYRYKKITLEEFSQLKARLLKN